MKKTLKTIVMMICVMEIFFTHTISNVVYAKDLMISDAKEIEKAAKSLGFKATDEVDKSKYQFIGHKSTKFGHMVYKQFRI